MSSMLEIYAVDLTRLKAVLGSNEAGLADAVAASQARVIEMERAEMVRTGTENPPDWIAALKGLIAGGMDTKTPPPAYAMALRLLCRHLGAMLYCDSVNWWFIDETEIAGRLVGGSEAPIPIPPTSQPLVGHLTSEEAKEEFARWSEKDLSHSSPGVQKFRVDFLDWLEDAARRGEGLVAFLL